MKYEETCISHQIKKAKDRCMEYRLCKRKINAQRQIWSALWRSKIGWMAGRMRNNWMITERKKTPSIQASQLYRFHRQASMPCDVMHSKYSIMKSPKRDWMEDGLAVGGFGARLRAPNVMCVCGVRWNSVRLIQNTKIRLWKRSFNWNSFLRHSNGSDLFVVSGAVAKNGKKIMVFIILKSTLMPFYIS